VTCDVSLDARRLYSHRIKQQALAEFAFLDADQKTFFPRFCTPAHDACRCYFSRRRHRRCCCCCFFLLVAVDVLLQLM
jgi:hypothetical protein